MLIFLPVDKDFGQSDGLYLYILSFLDIASHIFFSYARHMHFPIQPMLTPHVVDEV